MVAQESSYPYNIAEWQMLSMNALPFILCYSTCPSMPVTAQIRGPRGPDFWASFDAEDRQLAAEAVKEEVCVRNDSEGLKCSF